jgi:hypothetical protein
MPGTETWAAYYNAYATLREPMQAFMSALAAEFGATADEDVNGDDYGYRTTFTCNGIRYGAELQLWDAGTSSGDAEPGEMGNLHLSVCRDGGQIVIAWAPHNYSDECWVPYADTDELISRVPSPIEAAGCADTIRKDAHEPETTETAHV